MIETLKDHVNLNTRLGRIKQAHKEMDELMSNLSAFGAGDTEPDWHYQDAVRNALEGKPFESLNAIGWELYSGVEGVAKAASKLNKQTRKIVNLIRRARASELGGIRNWAKDNLWRVDIY